MRRGKLLGVLLFGLLAFLGGCHPKPKPNPTTTAPPVAPPPAAATATLTVDPTSIERGQSATLSWTTTNSSEVSIEGLGPVQPSGNRAVQPAQSTTYRLTAKSPGGEAIATARVTVTTPPPENRPVVQGARNPTEEELFEQQVRAIYFDYNSFDVRADQQSAMQGNAAFLRAHPNVRVVVEGHCDERGSAEYNVGLGDKRANSLKETLVGMGIPADHIRTLSYGKERPVCVDANPDEACYQKNRRGQFVLDR